MTNMLALTFSDCKSNQNSSNEHASNIFKTPKVYLVNQVLCFKRRYHLINELVEYRKVIFCRFQINFYLSRDELIELCTVHFSLPWQLVIEFYFAFQMEMNRFI